MADRESHEEAGGAADSDDGRSWPEPGRGPSTLGADRNRGRLGIRLACSVAVLLVLLWLTRGFLVEVVPRLWPPTEPTSQWATLVTLHAFGYVLVPLMIGSALADFVLDRVQKETE